MVADLKHDADAVWPTTGEMIAMLRRKQIEIDKGTAHQDRGWSAQASPNEVMATKAGILADRGGYRAVFLQDAMSGRVTPNRALTNDYIAGAIREAKAKYSDRLIEQWISEAVKRRDAVMRDKPRQEYAQ